MKKILLLFTALYCFSTNYAQDTIKTIDLKEVIILASRNNSKYTEIPSSVAILDSSYLSSFPITNIDNVLQSISGVYVNRSSGIYSKNASVTIRGFNGSNRVLVLYDGLPLNQLAGGGINWHLFNVNSAEKIEVLKGANSSQFGNNALSGIINIETENPKTGKHFNTSLSYSTYNTITFKGAVSNNKIKNEKGYYLLANFLYRKGDGYFIQNESDTTRAKLFLEEKCIELKYKYQFDAKHSLVVNYNFYSDSRGDGIKIYEPNGGTFKENSNMLTLSYNGEINDFAITIKSMIHSDIYKQHTEKINKTGDKYKLYDVNETTTDYMILANAIKQFNGKLKLNFGTDFKSGILEGEDKYYTSTDFIQRGGEINNLGLFAQMEYKFFEKLNFVAALRYDKTFFAQGYLKATGTTSETNIPDDTNNRFDQTDWSGISAKIGIKYFFTQRISAFAGVSTGFTPPKLDDMVSSRKINRGFKIANPYLKPENVVNYELGASQIFFNKIYFEQSVSFTTGYDFHYFLTLSPETDTETAIYQRKNIGKVNIYGYELNLKYSITENFYISGNYAYYNSEISEIVSENPTDKILENKMLSETPKHQAFAGINYKYKNVNCFIATNYIGKQWADELNTIELVDYFLVDAELQINIAKGLYTNFLAQNIFDKIFIDKKGGLCPGRFFQLEIGYRF